MRSNRLAQTLLLDTKLPRHTQVPRCSSVHLDIARHSPDPVSASPTRHVAIQVPDSKSVPSQHEGARGVKRSGKLTHAIDVDCTPWGCSCDGLRFDETGAALRTKGRPLRDPHVADTSEARTWWHARGCGAHAIDTRSTEKALARSPERAVKSSDKGAVVNTQSTTQRVTNEGPPSRPATNVAPQVLKVTAAARQQQPMPSAKSVNPCRPGNYKSPECVCQKWNCTCQGISDKYVDPSVMIAFCNHCPAVDAHLVAPHGHLL
jgi:hypothetical protein